MPKVRFCACVLALTIAASVEGRIGTTSQSDRLYASLPGSVRVLLSEKNNSHDRLSDDVQTSRTQPLPASRTSWLAALPWRRQPPRAGAAASSVTSVSDPTEVAVRHIWVTIGGERIDAAAGSLEYEDGEQAERSAPAEGALKGGRLPSLFTRRHLEKAPYDAAEFAAERAAAWEHIIGA